MLIFIIYALGILLYIALPLKMQIIILVLNTFLPDRLPYIDEIIMYSSTIKKLTNVGKFIEFMERNKKIVFPICVMIIVIVVIWVFRSLI